MYDTVCCVPGDLKAGWVEGHRAFGILCDEEKFVVQSDTHHISAAPRSTIPILSTVLHVKTWSQPHSRSSKRHGKSWRHGKKGNCTRI